MNVISLFNGKKINKYETLTCWPATVKSTYELIVDTVEKEAIANFFSNNLNNWNNEDSPSEKQRKKSTISSVILFI